MYQLPSWSVHDRQSELRELHTGSLRRQFHVPAMLSWSVYTVGREL